MISKSKILASARKTLLHESKALEELTNFLDENFSSVVNLILNSKGRVVITGIGKSAIVAKKIVATMNSTGTPAIFMHAADAIHGDLGLVQKDDVVIIISKSGNTPEIKVLIPLVKKMGNTIVGICGNMDSQLSEKSDLVLNTTVKEEACPNNLAPTTSTTAQMAMGDTVAVALIEARGFDSTDFAKYHPGGALGKKLYTRMDDLLDRENIPVVNENTCLEDVIIEISSKRLGATAVVDKNKNLLGIITDGDLRRMLQSGKKIEEVKAIDIMNTSPLKIEGEALAIKGFQLMEEHNVSQLVVLEKDSFAGIVHLHDIIKEGIY